MKKKSYEENRFPKCEQQKLTCMMIGKSGRCKALVDTHFDRDCPFFKTQKQVDEELAEIERRKSAAGEEKST